MAHVIVDNQKPKPLCQDRVLNSDEEFKFVMNTYRDELRILEGRMRGMMDSVVYDVEQKFLFQHEEMKAQTMLAIRHVEDARMRIGKVLQYADDGVSILDKK